MNEIRTLMEHFWIRRDTEKEIYFRVKRDFPQYKKFIQEHLGWRLISNERLLKLEKIPVYAKSYMGITQFKDTRDYCILSVLLMYLEDKEEQEQFLLSELIDFIGIQIKAVMDVDWNLFSHRKSLVRVLQFVEEKGMLRVYEGRSDSLSQGIGQEVLYENTGLSRYFAVNFMRDISGFESYHDFENPDMEENGDEETNRGRFRINRVYRKLVLYPAMYWNDNEDADSLYLKNQRYWVEKYLNENLGGRLDVHKNAAFWLIDEDDIYSTVHPREAMLPELVTLVCAEIRSMAVSNSQTRNSADIMEIAESEFDDMLLSLRIRWKEAWSKEYREMDPEILIKQIKAYMEDWMMIERIPGGIRILPGAGKVIGFYPKDYQEKILGEERI